MPKMNFYVVVALFIIALIFMMTCTVIGSYIFLFYCKKTIDEYNVFFHDYNHKTKMVIDKYGDFRISNAYLIMAPMQNFSLFIMNMVTMQNCKPIMDELMHVMLMVEIVINDNQTKLLLIEKTAYISILTDFKIDDTHMIYKIKMNTKQHGLTLRILLTETCNRIGKNKFFNWHIYKNNCQYFIKHLLRRISVKFNHKHFNFASKKKAKQYCNQMFYNKCAINLYYSCMIVHNFFQKYINNVRQHAISQISSKLF
jgi:hypothetical protein